jgi:prolyl 4-hydroxylase
MIEIAVISIVIYIFLGAPGFSFTTTKETSTTNSQHKASPKAENLVYPSRDLICSQRGYDAHIFSTSPLVVYIDGFLSDDEANHLIALR